MRTLPLPLGLAALALAAGCGGSSAERPAVSVSTVETAAAGSGSVLPRWLEARLAARPGPDVAIVAGTSDYAPGENRVTFLVIRGDGSLVRAPTATVLVASAGSQRPAEAKATLEPIGVEGHEHEGEEAHAHGLPDATELYVTHLDLPRPGRYWLVAEPAGKRIQALGALDVSARSFSPAVGSRAPASDNPTLGDGPAAEITTATPPDTSLLRYSIADSLAARVPFVAIFATPKLCESRTCGPVVAVAQAVQARLAGSGIRFIHIEIYRDNERAKGLNRWVREWNLRTEPWVFVVDRAGIIRAKFEGAVSAEELERAIRRTIL